MSKFKKIVNRHILYVAIIYLFIFVLTAFEIRCPLYYLLGVRCPTCGVTRALLSLFNLDVEGYFYYHPLAIPLVVSVLLMLHIKILKRQGIVYGFVAITLALNTALYIAREFLT